MTNKKYLKRIIVALFIASAIGGFIWVGQKFDRELWDGRIGVNQTKSREINNPVPVAIETLSFTQNYQSPELGFSFKYPDGYKVGKFDSFLPDGTPAHTVIVQDIQTQQGFQIVVSPFDEDIDITPERIKKDLSNLEIKDPQEVVLGQRKGLAFLSDNETFGNAAREVWFVFRGNLYQITTYASLDKLLQEILNTWTF